MFQDPTTMMVYMVSWNGRFMRWNNNFGPRVWNLKTKSKIPSNSEIWGRGDGPPHSLSKKTIQPKIIILDNKLDKNPQGYLKFLAKHLPNKIVL